MRFKTAAEAFSCLESFTNLEKAPNMTAREYRLDRMYALLPLFGNPQQSFRAVHVAGSKGKGSTAAFIASALTSAGLKTGLYASPHVESYKERISLSGDFFDDSLYASAASEMMDRIENTPEGRELPGGPPTTFELLTLLSFIVFKEAGCSWAVFETGLGGRLDATNVLLPEISVLTPIELEHTEYLGDTISAIAAEKAGIIKEGVPVFSSVQHSDAEAVFRKTAEAKNTAVRFPEDYLKKLTAAPAPPPFMQDVQLELQNAGGRTEVCEFSFSLRKAGRFQTENAALAAAVLAELDARKLAAVDTAAVESGFAAADLPGRMEVFPQGGGLPLTVLDGAHTARSAALASEAFLELAGGGASLIFGAVDGKDVESMAAVLSGRYENIIISKPGSFKKSSPAEVHSLFKASGAGNCLLIEDPAQALEAASGFGLPILVTGSFYMLAEIRPLIRHSGN